MICVDGILNVAAADAVAAELRAMFIADVAASKAETLKSGQGFSAADVDRYTKARARGNVVSTPKAKSWRS